MTRVDFTRVRYREVGGSGLKASVIGLGTWQWGSRVYWGYGRTYGRKEMEAILYQALEHGINLFDTAEIYGWGASERLLGDLIPAGSREDIIIATKYWPFRPLSSEWVFRAAERSRRRLGIDAIDLYQVHWPNYLGSTTRLMRSMERLVRKGVIRHIGVSNFSVKQLERARAALPSLDVVSNQVHYNLLARAPETSGLLDYCRKTGIGVIAWSPLEQGLLTGKFRPGMRVRGVRRLRPTFRRRNLGRISPLLEEIGRVARGHNVTMAQVAVNWLVSKDDVIAIPGASRPEQVVDLCLAVRWDMTEEERERIELAYPAGG